METLDAGQGRHVLALPDFRRLWLVGLQVSVARWLEMLVVGVVVFQATQSAFLVAAMTLLRMAPMGLLGVLIGVLADRVPRRLSLIGVVAVQAAAAGMLALLAWLGGLAVWHVALAACVGGLGWATDNPVRRMMVGEAVGATRMASAMSLDVVANNASRIAGPTLGGTLLAMLGPAEAFGLAFVLYLGALAMASRVRTGRAAASGRGAPVLREMRDSFRLALRLPRLRAVLLVTVVFNLFAWPCSSMIPVIAQASLGLGPKGTGVLASMDGIGALAGAVLVASFVRVERHAAIYVGGALCYLAGMMAFAVSPDPVIAGIALLFTGVAGAGFATMQATMTYLASPPEIRGKALGVLSTAIGTGLLGFLQIGTLADWTGAPLAVCIVGTQGMIVLALTRQIWIPLFESRDGSHLSHS